MGEGPDSPYAAQGEMELFGPEVVSEDGKLALGAARLEGIGHQKKIDRRKLVIGGHLPRHGGLGQISFGRVGIGHVARFQQVTLPPGRWPSWAEKRQRLLWNRRRWGART